MNLERSCVRVRMLCATGMLSSLSWSRYEWTHPCAQTTESACTQTHTHHCQTHCHRRITTEAQAGARSGPMTRLPVHSLNPAQRWWRHTDGQTHLPLLLSNTACKLAVFFRDLNDCLFHAVYQGQYKNYYIIKTEKREICLHFHLKE